MLSSPRFRRRLLWAGAGLVLCGAIAFAVVAWPRAEPEPPLVTPSGPPLEIAEPPEVPLTDANRVRVLAVAQRFLTTAVERKRVASSWELVHPELRQGLSRQEWAKGDIPVVPYPVDTARWRLGYSQEGVVGLEVYVLPERGSRLRPMVFDMEVKSAGSRWLVSNWAPQVTPGGPAPPEPSPERAAAEREAAALAEERTLGAAWLLFPVAAVLLVLAIPVGLGLRDRARNRRGDRLYAEYEARRDEGQSSSSSPS